MNLHKLHLLSYQASTGMVLFAAVWCFSLFYRPLEINTLLWCIVVMFTLATMLILFGKSAETVMDGAAFLTSGFSLLAGSPLFADLWTSLAMKITVAVIGVSFLGVFNVLGSAILERINERTTEHIAPRWWLSLMDGQLALTTWAAISPRTASYLLFVAAPLFGIELLFWLFWKKPKELEILERTKNTSPTDPRLH